MDGKETLIFEHLDASRSFLWIFIIF